MFERVAAVGREGDVVDLVEDLRHQRPQLRVVFHEEESRAIGCRVCSSSSSSRPPGRDHVVGLQGHCGAAARVRER